MRIYKSDGTYTENSNDTAFGWSFSDSNDSDEEMEKLEEEFRRKKPEKIVKYNPKIKMATISSVIDTKLPPEGLVEDEADLNKISLDFPSKQQVASLINPCSVETKMLLSIVHYAKYKTLEENDVINLDDLKKFKFVLNEETENDLKTQIEEYHENKEENKMSLMMELLLADMKCDMPCKTTEKVVESSDLGNSIKSCESSSEESKSSMAKSDYNRSEVLSSLGFGDTIDKSLEKFSEETYDMHFKIADLRRSYEEDLEKVDKLITEAKQFRRDVEETKYLDEIILLLNGDLEKMRPNNWPFRIFHKNLPMGPLNLII